MTEASHLRTLRVLDLIFYQRMKKENLMPREELARLFPNLPELIEIHSEGPSSPPAAPAPRTHTCLLQLASRSLSLVHPHPRASLSRRPSPVLPGLETSIPLSLAPSLPGTGATSPLSEGGAGSGHTALPQAPVSLLSVPDSWCEAMRKLREEGPIVKDIGDLMLARVRPEETGPLSHGCVSGGGGYGAGM